MKTEKIRLETSDEREGLPAKFWANIDAEIENGELPKP